MRTIPSKPHLPTIAAALILSGGFIFLGMHADAQETSHQTGYTELATLSAEAGPKVEQN